MSSDSAASPTRDCPLCPRLKDFRDANRLAHPTFHNAPVASFGPSDARLLIVGLAPGLRGANRTGRPFTGDYAGDLLYATLRKFGFAEGAYDKRPDDGLTLIDCRITNAVRCVPPENKPVGTEVKACRPFLEAEVAALPRLRVILCLGALSHGATLTTLGQRKSRFPFAHNRAHDIGAGPWGTALCLTDSYHCSRYNTNTGRLTAAMFEDVFQGIRGRLDG